MWEHGKWKHELLCEARRLLRDSNFCVNSRRMSSTLPRGLDRAYWLPVRLRLFDLHGYLTNLEASISEATVKETFFSVFLNYKVIKCERLTTSYILADEWKQQPNQHTVAV